MQRVPLEESGKLAQVCEEAPWEKGNNHKQGLERTVPSTHAGPGTVPVPTVRLEKLRIHGALGRGIKTVLPQEGNISPMLKPALVPLNKS